MTETAVAARPRSWSRRWRVWLRLLHSYLSLCALLGFLFFGVTGFVLNHREWFGLAQTTKSELEGDLPVEFCEEPNKLAIVEQLRKDFHIQAPLHEFEVEDLDLIVLFRRPGQSYDVVINREDGHAVVQQEISGLLAMFTEMHRGEGASRRGRLAIDIMAILLVLAAITGFCIWTTIPKQRKGGVIAMVLGTVVFLYLIL